ncbi:MAG: outer membrane beta-barrel protein [Xanthobacteraceae bacterium]|jgi:outer membrane immunogenic protein
MRTLFLALLATTSLSVMVAQPVSAADLPLPPVYKAAPAPPAFSWTGFYAGIDGGGGWGQTSHTASIAITGVPGLPPLTTGNFNVNGGIIGGTLGYNYQVGQWVLGAETDLNWSNFKGTFNGAVVGVPFSLSSQLNWLDTTRVRIGWAYDRALFYGTAGGAMGGLTASASATAAILGIGAAATLADTQTRFGWTAGAGIEYAVTNNISAKVEYLYVDLGSQNQILLDNVKFTTSMVRGGVNLKF